MKARRLFPAKAAVFIERQEPDWKITVIRTSLDKLAYQIVFLAFIVIDLVLRGPLLISMPETLGLRLDTQSPDSSKGLNS